MLAELSDLGHLMNNQNGVQVRHRSNIAALSPPSPKITSPLFPPNYPSKQNISNKNRQIFTLVVCEKTPEPPIFLLGLRRSLVSSEWRCDFRLSNKITQRTDIKIYPRKNTLIFVLSSKRSVQQVILQTLHASPLKTMKAAAGIVGEKDLDTLKKERSTTTNWSDD